MCKWNEEENIGKNNGMKKKKMNKWRNDGKWKMKQKYFSS